MSAFSLQLSPIGKDVILWQGWGSKPSLENKIIPHPIKLPWSASSYSGDLVRWHQLTRICVICSSLLDNHKNKKKFKQVMEQRVGTDDNQNIVCLLLITGSPDVVGIARLLPAAAKICPHRHGALLSHKSSRLGSQNRECQFIAAQLTRAAPQAALIEVSRVALAQAMQKRPQVDDILGRVGLPIAWVCLRLLHVRECRAHRTKEEIQDLRGEVRK